MPSRRLKDLPRTRPPLDRMLKIDALVRGGGLWTSYALAAELEVSRKTINRDLEFMRHRLDLPLEFDFRRNGYYYAETSGLSGGSFPLMRVTTGELLALFLARKALEQYQGTPFEAPLRNALDKISMPMREEVDFSWSDLESFFSFRTATPAVTDIALFDMVSRAVVDKKGLTFEYRKLNASRFEARTVNPYHLACLNSQWYLFAYDNDRNDVRTFHLHRMRNPKLERRRFRVPADFSPAKLLKNSFGVVEGGRPRKVLLRFDKFSAQLIRERSWHHTQEITDQPDGGVLLALSVGSFLEIQPWILSWGSHVEVVSPADLRRRVLAEHLRASRSSSQKGKPKGKR